MQLSEYLNFDATGLANLVRAGEISAQELLACAEKQSAHVNPQTNAVCQNMHEQAKQQLQHLDLKAPFAGVPFLLKDIAQHYAGVPTSQGSRSMMRDIPSHNSYVVDRFLQAGLVVFGKTSLPEFALKAVTEPLSWGVTKNPWDLGRTPGGSSGGAAAVVASGVVPMAAASDGGGSIRIPSAYCGLFGLRPSRGRVSNGPDAGEIWSGATSHGVISRSVRDSARALDVIQGAHAGDPFHITEPTEAYAQSMLKDPGRLKIGFSTQSPIGTPVSKDAVVAVQDAVTLLRSLGHDVEERTPDIDGQALAVSYLHMYFGHVHAVTLAATKQGARRQDFELLTRVIAALGGGLASGRFVQEQSAWNQYARKLSIFHHEFDFYLTPTVSSVAPVHGATDLPRLQNCALSVLERTGLLKLLAGTGLLANTIDQIARDSLAFVPFTQLSNLTGTPSMSVPLYWTPDNLPLGVQFIAPFGKEDRLLQLAHQLEQVRPWFHRLPDWIKD